MVARGGAAPEDPGIMHTAREAHIQKVTLVVTDGLKLNRVEQFPVRVVGINRPGGTM